MALIKCPECGKEISSETKNCPNCGCPIKKDDNKKKSKMLAAVILNTLAVVIPVLFFILLNNMTEVSEETNGGISIELANESSYSSKGLLYCVCVIVITAILGYVIFFMKNEKAKRSLAFVYLLLAILGLVMMLASAILYIVFACGFGFILLVPGILQIIAGIKYVSATGK